MFGLKVFEVLDRIGQDAAWLSAQTGITQAAISKWKLDPKRQPKPSSVKRIAKVFESYGVSFEELADAAGYSLVASSSASEREERLLMLMRANPRIAKLWDKTQLLSPDEQDEMLSMVEAWLMTRRGRRSRE